jgi:acyl-CoA thioester hydrolase
LKNPPVVARIAIRYKDPDPYRHVNNAVYLEFFDEIRIAYWRALAKLEDRPEGSFDPEGG